MKIGLFGGTFDPVHLGHLLLAERCREECALDEVWFLPAHIPPHKINCRITASHHRLRMLELAISGNDGFRISPVEIERGGVSYTLDTVREVTQESPATDFYFLMEGGWLSGFSAWKGYEEICQLVKLVAATPGQKLAQLQRELRQTNAWLFKRAVFVEIPLFQISGSEIRERVRDGRSVRFLTPRPVEEYILSHNLYRN